MAFSLPSSSSSPRPTPIWSYDVFLSFRGTDTRNTFIAHLYSALSQRGIKTYKDDKDLERGDTISPALLKAIEESMISVIVLSSNYASSTWCLEELTKILECKKTKQQIVLAVFYHVDPSEVRNQRGSFGEAMAEHQKRFEDDPSKVQRWQEALQEVAGLAGEHLEDGNEYDFMQKIIQWVVSKVVKFTYQLDNVEYPIGLESRLKELHTDLAIGRNDMTLMIGIYGTGGIGKTTIAKAIFNSIGHQFEARCFLENVREISSREDGLVKLQKRLLDDLFGNFGSFNIGGVGGTNFIKDRLRSKRVLIILDDVSNLCQLKKLAGNHNWFGPGSRIVITTRDQHLLTYHPVDSTYEVQGLDYNQAIQLFSWHAFNREKPIESFVELTTRLIGYAKGLPLALTVLGSDLCGRNIEEWESALEKYKRTPPKDIYEILKISYDGLDDNEKIIFLDITCFFKGQSVEYVTKMLDICRFSSSFGIIRRLKEKCLINISTRYYCRYVEMHDLLQEMGKEIVRQESPKEAGERSRLWFHEDIRHVLEENTGTNKIEAIWLDFPYGQDKIRLHPKAFKKMKNLRLFINRNAQFSEGPNYLSNELRLLDWPNYPGSFLPSNFRGNNLVKFQMPHSLIKELGGLKSKNLTEMVLSGCEFITKIPNLSSCPNLERLILSDFYGVCENLVEIHDSVGLLDKLRTLDVRNCRKLRILPKRFKLRSLSSLDIIGCSNLEDFPEIECEMELLHSLNLFHTSIKELPSSIDNLKGLKWLYLSKFSLEKLPSLSGILTRLQELLLKDGFTDSESIDKVTLKNSEAGNRFWEALKKLTLERCCLSETNFFRNNYFPALEGLDLSESDIVIFPPQGVRFDRLRYLTLSCCDELEEILPLPLSLERVVAQRCTSLGSFALLSEIPYGNNNIKWIDLYGCHKLFANENMRPIPSQEESHSKEQHWENQLKVRDIEIIFPRKRILSWFNCRIEVCMSDDYESNVYEIDINPPQHWNDIDGIVLYAAFKHDMLPFERDQGIFFSVTINDRSDWEDSYTSKEIFDFDDHVWMHWVSYDRQEDVSRLRFECSYSNGHECPLKDANVGNVGIHFLKKHEKRPSSIWELENDDENPNQDLELENADENPKEVFGKRRRDDEYDCNMEPNWYPKQKRQHSSTMGITITELENEDENPKDDTD